MISSMGMGQSHGNFIKSGILDSLCWGRRLAGGGLSLRVGFMMVILLMGSFMELASIILGSREKCMRESLLIIIWKAKVL